jgi:hypothetical protein
MDRAEFGDKHLIVCYNNKIQFLLGIELSFKFFRGRYCKKGYQLVDGQTLDNVPSGCKLPAGNTLSKSLDLPVCSHQCVRTTLTPTGWHKFF